MIVIVANRWDQTPKVCASRWAVHDCGVLTARDLSATGWQQRPSGLDKATAVVAGRHVPQAEITGVLTLIPGIADWELLDIAPEDRSYVASEMTAFLVYWLSSLACPVLNRPTPLCLSGPNWRREQWVDSAARAGLAVQSFRRHSALGSGEEATASGGAVVTVAGRSVIGDAASELHLQARRLADFAKVELLAVHFSSPEPDARFVTASPFANLTDDRVADAVLEYLRAG
jgi:hypothetical protein